TIKHRATPIAAAEAEEAVQTKSEEVLETMGHYRIIEVLQRSSSEELLRGIDPRLGRTVWIRRYSEDRPALTEKRRGLDRAGRLRWIDGRRAEGEAWDAFEGVPGKVFRDAVVPGLPWPSVRQWLLDMAREIVAISESEEEVLIAQDRIWIGSDGRARLLEFSVAESDEVPKQAPAAGDLTAVQVFLHRLARSALEGQILTPSEAQEHTSRAQVPERIYTILDKLRSGRYESLMQFVEEFEVIEADAAELSRFRRILPIATAWAPALFIIISLFIAMVIQVRSVSRDPEAMSMNYYLGRLQTLQEESKGDARLEALERYVAGRFAIKLGEIDSSSLLIPEDRRALARDLLERYPGVTQEEVEQAAVIAGEWINTLERRASRPLAWTLLTLVFILCSFSTGFVALVGFIASLPFPRGLLLRIYGIAIVDKSGAPATRWRAFRRMFWAWFPGLACLILLFASDAIPYELRTHILYGIFRCGVGLLVVFIYILGFICAIYCPTSGLPDRLAGTRLVRR
ncbi:hypothetical protein ACFLU6_15500, partial [Acidobacteriota bacterium]